MSLDNIVYKKFIEFQLEIINALLDKRKPEEIAHYAREAIKSVYGYPIPNDAELAINVNERCNLECAHCYYTSTHDKKLEHKNNLLNKEEWQNVIDDSIAAGFRHFSIIGKEPLLSPEIIQIILQTLEDQKEKYSDIKYEMITNGTLIQENIHWIKNFNFNFLSVSFDGYKEHHDLIRGKGSYLKSKKGLSLLATSKVKNLSVTNTVMLHNFTSLNKMIHDLHEAGAEYFSIGFCFPTEYNDSSHAIDSGEIFLETLKQLSGLPQDIDVSVNLSVYESPNLVAKVLKLPEFNRQNFAVTEDLAPALIMPLHENPRVAVQLSILPIMYYGGFRLDCTGYTMDFCSDLYIPEKRKGFGNVRNTSIKELWKYSREELWPKHTENFYKELAEAIG